jgi:hypothetical protein
MPRHPSTPLLFAALLAAAGCSSSAPPPPKPSVEVARPVKVDRAVLRAFKAYVYASYGLILGRERPAGSDPALLRERQELAREELRQALVDAGAKAESLGEPATLVAAVREGIETGGRYAMLVRPGEVAAESVLVVRIQELEAKRSVRLFGKAFGYRLTSYDETIVADYPTWRAEQLRQPVAREVATYRRVEDKGLVQVDRSAAREIGARLFLPQVERLRAAASAADEAAFVQRAPQLAQLLSLAKTVLRWRSLEGLWSRIATRGRDTQLARFTEDYSERAELRAVAELHALAQLKLTPNASAEERQRLFELGTLSAAIHGDPLGQVADVLGLAVISLDGPRHAPHYRAARQLVLDLVAKLRQGAPSGDRNDALALSRLARAPAETLRRLARELHAERLAAPVLEKGDSEPPEPTPPSGG